MTYEHDVKAIEKKLHFELLHSGSTLFPPSLIYVSMIR